MMGRATSRRLAMKMSRSSDDVGFWLLVAGVSAGLFVIGAAMVEWLSPLWPR